MYGAGGRLQAARSMAVAIMPSHAAKRLNPHNDFCAMTPPPRIPPCAGYPIEGTLPTSRSSPETDTVQRDADVQHYPSDEPLRLAIENFNRGRRASKSAKVPVPPRVPRLSRIVTAHSSV